MQKKINFYFLLIILTIYSCMNEPKNTIPSISLTPVSIRDSVGDCEERNCLDLKIQYLKAQENNPIANSISDTLNRYTSAAIVDGLVDSIIVIKDVQEAVRFARKLYDEDKKLEKEEQMFLVFSTEITMKEVYRNNKVLCVSQDVYRFMGGAHPLTTIALFTFDLKTGKTVELKDIVIDEEKFLAIVEKYLRKEHEIPANQSLQEAGFMYGSMDLLPLPIDYSIDENGLHLVYNQYEIAPYAMGISSLTIPFSELDKIIKLDKIR